MRRNWAGIAGAVLMALTAACSAGSAAPAAPPAAFAGTRGINLHNWFTWTPQVSPNRYTLPVFRRMPGELSPPEARALRTAGFDFVRLTVDPGVFMSLEGPDLDRATAALEAGVDRLRGAGLSVIVDMHPVSRFVPDPGSGRVGVKAYEAGVGDPVATQFQAAIARLAGALDRRYGATRAVAFELLNEPDLTCGATSWRVQQAALHRAVRAAAPHLTLVLGGTCWNGIGGLTALKATDYADPNTLFTFHFYDDHHFTHQGTNTGEPDRSTSGLPYPWDARDRATVDADTGSRLAMLANADTAAVRTNVDRYLGGHWNRAKIDGRMDQVVAWAKANDIAPDRILMGEFGVNASRGTVMGARAEDRLRWLADVRQAAEARGFRWSMWLYRGNNKGGDDFDLVSDGGSTLDPAALTALGLTANRRK